MGAIRNTRELVLESATTPVAGVYLVGPFGARVSFASQQLRALNVVWALCKSGVIKRNVATDVAVVGGGIAGVTAAAALLSVGCSVFLFDAAGDVLTLQRGAHHRTVHPTLNFWPDDPLRWTTELPFFDWFAGTSVEVIRHIAKEWEECFSSEVSELNRNTVVSNLTYDNADKKVVVWVDGKEFRRMDLAFVATGFGVERDHKDDLLQTTYWRQDEIDALALKTGAQLAVSGTGDGGVIDSLRLTYPQFMEKEVALRFILTEDTKALRDQVVALEAKALKEADLAKRSKIYAAGYRSIALSRTVGAKKLLPGLADGKLPDGKLAPLLVGELPQPFEIGAAPIHKLILAHAIEKGHIAFMQGTLQRQTDGTYVVNRPDGSVYSLAAFARVFVRHGASPPIERMFGQSAAAEILKVQRTVGDFTRIPDMRADFFNNKLYPDRGSRSQKFVDRRLPLAGKLLETRFGLGAKVNYEDVPRLRFEAMPIATPRGDRLFDRRHLPGKLFGITLLPPASERIREARNLVGRC